MVKTFKMAKKKVPPEKFVVVVNAWGYIEQVQRDRTGPQYRPPWDWPTVAAWFEVMLREEYPGLRVKTIYYQRTHDYLIVELPREVKNIQHYLGLHYYSQFLTNRLPNDHKYAAIYLYRYSTFGDPSLNNWTAVYPQYEKVPSNIPLRQPYPPPLPSQDPPPSGVVWARPLDAEVYNVLIKRFAAINDSRLNNILKMDRALAAASSITDSPHSMGSQNHASSSTQSMQKPMTSTSRPNRENGCVEDLPVNSTAFTPYVPPSHYTAHLKDSASQILPIEKLDPYEAEEVAQELLRSISPIKNEVSAAADFLDSFLPRDDIVKEEEKSWIKDEAAEPEEEEDNYEPSAELLALLGTLPPEMVQPNEAHPILCDDPLRIKPEPVDIPMPGYHSPPHDVSHEETWKNTGTKTEYMEIGVKPEPLDDLIPEYEPSDELLAALSSLPPDIDPARQDQNCGRIKEESRDDTGRLSRSRDSRPTPFRVKQEPSSSSSLPEYPFRSNSGFSRLHSREPAKREPRGDGDRFDSSRSHHDWDARSSPPRDPRRRPNDSSASSSQGQSGARPDDIHPRNPALRHDRFSGTSNTLSERDPRRQSYESSSGHRNEHDYEHSQATNRYKRVKREYK